MTPRALRRRRATGRLARIGVPVRVPGAAPPRLAAVLAGAGTAAVLRAHLGVAVAAGLLVTATASIVLPGVLRRSARTRRARRLEDDLPVALDLIGACLAAGATVAEAVGDVGVALDSDLARALATVGRALRRGVPDAHAWAHLSGPSAPAAIAALARAAVRSAATGSALEPWLAELAAEVRSEQEAASLRAAQRAGVLAVLPLGLCALPAYVLLAVVPAVVGLLRRLT